MGASLDHADASVRARCVELQAASLGIRHLFPAVDDKLAAMNALLAELSLGTDAADYIGDDLPLMHASAFSATRRDAHALVQQHASLTTVRGGGRVTVREACECKLETQGELASAQAASRPSADGQ